MFIGKLHSAIALLSTHPADLLDSARETAARRLAPWLGDSADREERSSAEAAEAIRAQGGMWERAVDAETARDKAVADAKRRAEALEQMAERLGEANAARDAWAARAEAAEAQRDGARVAIEAALTILRRANVEPVERILDAHAALRSVAWAEPDAAEAEEQAGCVRITPGAPNPNGIAATLAAPPVDPSRVVFAADLLHDANPDTPVPYALTCKGTEACLRGEEIARLTAERDGLIAQRAKARDAVGDWLRFPSGEGDGDLIAALRESGWL